MSARRSSWLSGAVRQFLLPRLQIKTDRLIRALLWTDALFLLVLSLMAECGLIAFAAILAGNAVGAVGGLLFAVPRRVAAAADGAGGQQVGYLANTSLEEVSDWLTKTIIGAGLVSWQYVLASLDRAGRILGWGIAGNDPDLAIASGVSIILAATSFGALIGYLWFARHWPTELAEGDVRMRKVFAAMGLEQSTEDVAPATPSLPPAKGGDASAPGDGGPKSPDGEGRPAGGRESLRAEGSDPSLSIRSAAENKYALMRKAPRVPHDWAKKMFGGQSRVTNSFGARELTASVRQLDSQWYEVNLEVTASPTPETEVIFFLHNTFKNPTPTAGFGAGGVARLTVTAYGAFTVGALVDDGTTELELDLAEVADAPPDFKNR